MDTTPPPLHPPPHLQAALHWDVAESTQLAAPMGVGLLLFDLVYMVALLLKLRIM